MSIVLTFIEIDVDRCALVYGDAPCEAELGVTGDFKCFNSVGSCQDRDNFDPISVTLRFAVGAGELMPREIECIPSIVSIDFTPSVVAIGVDLGQRATLKIGFKDHPDSDTGPAGDKYLAERDYNPWDLGSFWGKFRARNPYLRGRAVRWIQGRLPSSFTAEYAQGAALPDGVLAEQETRHFILDSFDGPTPEGRYTLVAKDILKLADSDRAQAPRLSNGFLSAPISDADFSATLSPAGIGNEEYAPFGYACIGGNEVVAFSRSGDMLTLTRGQHNTTAVSHEAQSRVQFVLTYDALSPDTIIAHLLQIYAGIDPSYIPAAAWAGETATYLGTLYSSLVVEPTPVSKLISELIEQAALSLWWDDINRLIQLRVLRAVPATAVALDEANILEDSMRVREQPDRRISRVQTYFDRVNPTKKVDDLDNYRSSNETVDDQAETDYGSQAIKSIFSRWIPSGGRSVAERLNSIQLARFRDPPRRFNFDLFRTIETVVPQLGAAHQLQYRNLQDVRGARASVPIQITALKPGDSKFEIEAEEILFSNIATLDPTERSIILDVGAFNINVRALHDQLYPTPQSGDNVTVIVQPGVSIGSYYTTVPALDIGAWPPGVTITLDVRGLVEGRGGKGADGAGYYSYNPLAENGGTAIYTRYPITLLVPGLVWGGGGGGGCGGGLGGGGGGAGAGHLGSLGGTTWGGVSGGGSNYLTPGFGALAGTTYFPFATAAGGNGGPPGLDGNYGQPYGGLPGGAPGSGGYAIDGASYVTVAVPGDIRGSQVN